MLFRQITTFIKVRVVFVFGLQTHWLMDLSKIFQLKGLKPKDKSQTNFYKCCDLTKKLYLVWGILYFKYSYFSNEYCIGSRQFGRFTNIVSGNSSTYSNPAKRIHVFDYSYRIFISNIIKKAIHSFRSTIFQSIQSRYLEFWKNKN